MDKVNQLPSLLTPTLQAQVSGQGSRRSRHRCLVKVQGGPGTGVRSRFKELQAQVLGQGSRRSWHRC